MEKESERLIIEIEYLIDEIDELSEKGRKLFFLEPRLCDKMSAKSGKKWREEHPEEYKAMNRRSYQKNREKVLERRKEYRLAYPERLRARELFKNAVRSGKIKKEDCKLCTSNYLVEGHHKDYSKPLEVIWLCNPCHKAEHL